MIKFCVKKMMPKLATEKQKAKGTCSLQAYCNSNSSKDSINGNICSGRLDITNLNIKSCNQDEEIKLHANLTAQCSASY